MDHKVIEYQRVEVHLAFMKTLVGCWFPSKAKNF